MEGWLLIFTKDTTGVQVERLPLERVRDPRPAGTLAVVAAIDTAGTTWFEIVRNGRQFTDYSELARAVRNDLELLATVAG